MAPNLENLNSEFEIDPGSRACVALAEALIAEDSLDKALHVCLRGLSTNPNLHLARLLLAKLYYKFQYVDFALKEIKQLAQIFPEIKPLAELRQKLSGEGENCEQSSETENSGSEKSDSVDQTSPKLSSNKLHSAQPVTNSGPKVNQKPEQTVAEDEFDIDELEMLIDEKKH